MNHNPGEQDDLVQGIYPASPPRHAAPSRKDFKPWHKPRKQYVRRHQWCDGVKALVGEITMRDGRPLKYMSLPGEDMLDIRALHGVCQEASVQLRFLGFNRTLPEDVAELNISNHEVSRLSSIDGTSVVLRDDLESLSVEDSLARKRMDEYGPFDVVNLDLCNSLASTEPQTPESYYHALHHVVNYQSTTRTEPWLLFLTTRADYGTVNESAMGRFLDCIDANLATSAGFSDTLQDMMDINGDTTASVRQGFSNRHRRDQRVFVKTFGIGVAKWLMKLVMGTTPRWHMSMLPSYRYAVGNGHPDMISFSFRFDLIVRPGIDTAGISALGGATDEPPSEHELATALIPQIRDMADLDELLASDPKLRSNMISESADLLEGARYSPEAYRQWAERQVSRRSRARCRRAGRSGNAVSDM